MTTKRAGHGRRAIAAARVLGLEANFDAISNSPARSRAGAPLSWRASLDGAQRGRCYLCGRPFGKKNPETNCAKSTFEHVIPRALGGRNVGNRLLAGIRCNEAKADRWPHPCELIALAAVNARLGLPTARPWTPQRQPAAQAIGDTTP
jgi:hypothetical protein